MQRSKPRYGVSLRSATVQVFFTSLCAALAGCSAQATTDYQGEPLFSMTGRIELALEAPDDLVPALAFTAAGGYEVHFMQAEVSGEFPASFRLDLYTPPPEPALDAFTYEEHPGELRYSIGYVIAARPDHLPVLYFGSSVVGQGEEDACTDEGCTGTFEVTSFDARRRGTVTAFCPPGASASSITGPFECEVTGRTGDPMLVSTLKDPMFAGAVDNYAVAYLESAAPAGGFVARRLGAPEGLPAGYHLLRTMPWITSWPETADSPHVQAELAKQGCRDEAKQLAVERYNAAHGTEVGTGDIVIPGCHEPGCEQLGPHTRGLRGEWYRAMVEMDCFFPPDYALETDPDAVVSLTVQPGLNFLMAASGAH